MEFTFLGTGTSCGIPTIGCNCEVCTSTDPRDKRTRCSALVETPSTRLLIDCGPDFRQQILPQPFRKIDAVLVTHIHFDHVAGLDDLRPYCKFGDIDILCNESSLDTFRQTMPYCFGENLYPGVPKLNFKKIEKHQHYLIGDLNVTPIEVMHGKLPILGYRINDLAYITDMKSISEEEVPYLEGIDTLIVNALRFDSPHHSHQLVDDAIAFAQKIGARRTFFIHMSHHVGKHEEASKKLPPSFFFAYDGLKIDI